MSARFCRRTARRNMAGLCGFLLTSVLPPLCSLPVSAQSWQISVSGTPTATSGTGAVWTAPAPATGYLALPSWTATNSLSANAGQTVSGAAAYSAPFHFTFTWQPGAGNAPAPAVLRLSETPSSGWSFNSFFQSGGTFDGTTGSTANDGFGDLPVNQTSSGTHTSQFNPASGLNRSLSATCQGTLTATNGGASASLRALLNGYTLQVLSLPGALKVDQDQQVFAPAPTTRFSATVSNLNGCVIDWIKLSVDGGTPITATIPTGTSSGYIDWNSAGAANPSEHSITATAQIHDSIGVILLDSTRPEGNGRPADDIIAKIVPQSFAFSSLPLNQDATTLVPNTQITWDSSGNRTPNYLGGVAPAAFVRATTPLLDLALYNTTGTATIGFTLDLKASPNTADPSLLLYETGSTPKPCTATNIFSAQVSIYNYVAYYNCFVRDLTFYVQFTKTGVPAAQAPWKMVSSYASSSNVIANTMYGLCATPTAPMAPTTAYPNAHPWTKVLDYACLWAGGASDATSATTALAKGLYNNGTYNGGKLQDTDNSTKPQTFYLLDFLTGSTALFGQCDDFSDFFVCVSNAIGAHPLQSQRADGSFQTNPITLAHDQAASDAKFQDWAYHQWTGDSAFFDGLIRFEGTTTPANLTLSNYEYSLIEPGFFPILAPLFTPIIKNTKSNP